MEISFTYSSEDKSRFQAPELIGATLVDLFEAADMLVHIGAFENGLEGAKSAGFLPSFVEYYREKMGSEMQWILETTEEEHAAELNKSWDEVAEEMESWEDPTVDFDFDASEAEDWAELWLDFLNSPTLDPTSLQAILPYNFKSAEYVKADLQQLRALAAEAKSLNVQLNLHAMMG